VSHEDVRTAAEALLRNVVMDPRTDAATLEQPIPVLGPAGEVDSWFVALTTEEGILGFLQLDAGAIEERAQAAAAEGDELGKPVLTYRGNRDRLTWRVPILNRPGSIYVAGDYVDVSLPAT
jgi:hypothetical protein